MTSMHAAMHITGTTRLYGLVGDPVRTALLRRRVELNTQLEELRARKETMQPEDYESALEKILLELARVDRSLKSKS